jgi:hypothetical protein
MRAGGYVTIRDVDDAEGQPDLDESAQRLRHAAREAIEAGTPLEDVAAMLGIDVDSLAELIDGE